MKKIALAFLSICFVLSAKAQTTFWTEDFNNGQTGAYQLATGYTSVNGAWTNQLNGTQGGSSNRWYISSAECGNAAGACGTTCTNDASLHVGARGIFYGGASYNAGGLGNVTTDITALSPVINCTGYSTITLSFNYIGMGEPCLDKCDLDISTNGGTSWTTQQACMVSTVCGSGQGRWTAYSVVLPAAADNNPNVRIAFHWINNNNVNGADPSFAVDDITLSVSTSAPVPVVTITPIGSTTICQNASITLNGSATNSPTSWQWTSNPSTGVTYSPASNSQNVGVSFTTPGTYTFTLTATNAGGNGSTTQTVTVNATNPVSVALSSMPVTPVCDGTPIVFQATPTGGGLLPTYTWFENGVQVQSGNSPLYNATANANDTIIVQMTPFNITCPLPAIAVDTFVIQTNAPVTPSVSISSNPATFCAGTNVTFTANPTNGGAAPTYVWTLNGFPVGLGTDTYSSSTLANNDTLIVTMLSNQTCVTGNSATDTFAIQVIPSPNLSVIQDSVSVCPGAPAVLIASATAGSTFSWSPGTDLDQTTNDTVVATISANGNYTYTVTATLGTCVETDSVVVQVSNNLTTSITGASSVCLGDSTQLSAANGTTWTWSPAAGLSCTNCQNPMASPATNTDYTVNITSGACTASATHSLTVNSTPTSVLISTPAIPVCDGSTIALQATPTNGGLLPTYTWFENGVQMQSNNLPLFNPTANNNDTIIVHMASTATNCPVPAIAIDTFVIQTTAPVTPAVNITANPATFCTNTNVTFTANPTNGGTPTYVWTLNGFPVGLGTDTYSSSTLADGDTLIVNMLSTQFCTTGNTAADTFVVDILPSPGLTVVQGSTTICPGGSATLIVSATAGSSFSWSPGTDLNTTTNDTVIATINTLGTYTYTVTSALGACTENQSVTVTVSNNLTAAITGGGAVCEGSSTTLSVNAGSTWSWSPAAGLSCTNCQNPVATPGTSTVYTVDVTSGSCTASATHSITVNSEPVVSVAPISICSGGSGQLQATGISGNNYQWIPTTDLSCNNCSNPTANPANTAIYAVVGTDANGCDDTTSVLVTVNPLPVISIVQGNTTFCPGGSDTLVVSADAGSTFSWSPASGLNNTTDDSVIVSLSTAGITQYTVTASLNGCSGQQMISVNVTNNLTVTVNPVAYCSGGSAQLFANGGSNWTWSPAAGLSCTTCQNPIVSGTTTNTYTVNATQGTCTASNTVVAAVSPNPDAAYLFSTDNTGMPQSVTFDNNSTNATSYTWNFGDGSSVSTASNPSHVYTEEGNFPVTLIAFNSNGCGPDTITYTVVVFDGSSVIVPNIFTPNGDQINETLDITTKGISELICTIYDRWGIKVAELDSPTNPKWDGKTASGNAASEGTYFYILKATGIDNRTFDLKGSVLLIK
jgi:gliding motility-associated-like protein